MEGPVLCYGRAESVIFSSVEGDSDSVAFETGLEEPNRNLALARGERKGLLGYDDTLHSDTETQGYTLYK